VDHADRKAITATRTVGTPWEPDRWHRLKLVHDAASGSITIYFDDMEKPVLTAHDKTLDHGWIGLGSFDDLGKFRNLEIRGEKKVASRPAEDRGVARCFSPRFGSREPFNAG